MLLTRCEGNKLLARKHYDCCTLSFKDEETKDTITKFGNRDHQDFLQTIFSQTGYKLAIYNVLIFL